MRISRRGMTALLAAPLAATLLISCSSAEEQAGNAAPATSSSSPPATATPDAGGPADDGGPAGDGGTPTPPPVRVRDAFAGLQATLSYTCTPSDCAFNLGRIHDELDRLDRAMKADPKGPGHFPEPIAWIKDLRTTLNGDRSTENLKKHRTELFGTRDRINTWMQDHPDDYR
ncbi:hypothetical protein ACFYV5_03405 [Streptomyces sp. NPDC003035]|uniref:hypothetical protein n=1 Tax=Streptomyces sp. NPDC003035 TaxID=3364676 RepID=UPI00367859DD